MQRAKTKPCGGASSIKLNISCGSAIVSLAFFNQCYLTCVYVVREQICQAKRYLF